jgi:hypothetical protein
LIALAALSKKKMEAKRSLTKVKVPFLDAALKMDSLAAPTVYLQQARPKERNY